MAFVNSGVDDEQTHLMSLKVTATAKTSNSQFATFKRVWDPCLVENVTQSKSSVKGNEVSIWDIEINSSKIYNIVPSCIRSGVEGKLLNI
jgi:hypothetical protein